eukprot:TRINITY_DN7668_c0_g1_i1.p1 TRINITY_DN7668_c0_g1~~TRINITY_DN7668_c0_g1_i1.p1  ORF type:complete len:134 (-),score=30.99 TRINITY_DN7668_c0_g1_i1:218-619(-)
MTSIGLRLIMLAQRPSEELWAGAGLGEPHSLRRGRGGGGRSHGAEGVLLKRGALQKQRGAGEVRENAEGPPPSFSRRCFSRRQEELWRSRGSGDETQTASSLDKASPVAFSLGRRERTAFLCLLVYLADCQQP